MKNEEDGIRINLRASVQQSDGALNLKNSQDGESDTTSRFRELTVKTKWSAAGGSPEAAKGSSLKSAKEQRFHKGVSFKEEFIPLDAND